MTTTAPQLSTALRRCVAELGMWSACRLFLETARASGGEQALDELVAELGVEFPVLASLATDGVQDVRCDAVLEACAGMSRIVVCGLEADCLEPLLAQLDESVRVALLLDTLFPADLVRIDAAWGKRVERVDVASYQRFAGARSALITPVYGSDAFRAVVCRAWLRCHNDDVRLQFRHILGWNVLVRPLHHFPRWLVETDAADFTRLV